MLNSFCILFDRNLTMGGGGCHVSTIGNRSTIDGQKGWQPYINELSIVIDKLADKFENPLQCLITPGRVNTAVTTIQMQTITFFQKKPITCLPVLTRSKFLWWLEKQGYR